MSPPSPILTRRARLPGLVATLAVHLALLLGWQMTRHAPVPPGASERMYWVNVPMAQAAKRREEAAAPARAPQARPAARASRARAPVRAAAPAPPQPIVAPAQAPAESAAEAPGKSGYDILQQARRDLGKISKDLGKEFPEQKIKAPRNTAQTRLEKGIALANELAPPKWYEAPKIKEIVDPGSYGRRRYRITTALGTYCMTYESNHAPDGIDVIARGMQQKRTTCPKDELPPTKQEGL